MFYPLSNHRVHNIYATSPAVRFNVTHYISSNSPCSNHRITIVLTFISSSSQQGVPMYCQITNKSKTGVIWLWKSEIKKLTNKLNSTHGMSIQKKMISAWALIRIYECRMICKFHAFSIIQWAEKRTGKNYRLKCSKQ